MTTHRKWPLSVLCIQNSQLLRGLSTLEAIRAAGLSAAEADALLKARAGEWAARATKARAPLGGEEPLEGLFERILAILRAEILAADPPWSPDPPWEFRQGETAAPADSGESRPPCDRAAGR